MITRRLAAIVALTMLLSATLTRAESAPNACHKSWPVVAHRSGGRIVRTATHLPIPCATETGFATSESSIAVNNRGAIFYSPANTENTMARSLDGGATWNLVQPQRMEYTNFWNTVDPYVTVDRRTGRVFWVHVTGPLRTTSSVVDDSQLPGPPTFLLAFAYGFQVYSSDDDGHRWTTADYRYAPMTDWEKLFVGPPPAGSPKPVGYPNVVYVCANSPVEVVGPGRLCYKSLDGGRTFDVAGYVFPSASTPDACGALNTTVAVVDSKGTIFMPVTCSNGSYLAVSRDEGASYEWLPVPGVPGGPNGPFPGNIAFQVAVDASDNLSVMWLVGDRLLLATSRTNGRTWSAPASIAGPGLHQITIPALAAGPRGSVGVVYYASRAANAPALTAYLTETQNALATRPLFVTAALNDPKRPIFHDYGLFDSPRADFIGSTYDASGALWAGVVKQLGPPDANGRIATIGYVGRLR